MTIILYSVRGATPPGRAVETFVKILNLVVDIRYVDFTTREHRLPSFQKLNPAQQIPVLDDNGYVLTDSHAIIAYLLTVYGSKEIVEEYYPTDPKKRGLINAMWHFETGMLFDRLKAIILPLYMKKDHDVPLDRTEWLADGLKIFDDLLEGKKWMAGDRLSVADISAIATIDLIDFVVPVKYYKNIREWAERVRRTSPFYEEVRGNRVDQFEALFKKFNYDAEERWNRLKG
ncbi:glutathione S-transferase 1-like isoform X3 [Athalia rosae]|uniref:glutathione S-transferase 1-like isoform X3 n=1 Tax=Athalia rosae TaxID=37344 RepID=UPI0020346EAE|nr:glutathione S-transferase 1-like isoform X3 [Athalia rosae]